MSFITDAVLKAKLNARLKRQDPVVLESWWTALVTDANVSAYAEIVTHLLARGYSKAQIDTWDRGAEFQGYIGLYFLYRDGAGLEGYDDKWVEKLKYYLDSLATVPIAVGDVLLVPANPSQIVGHGDLDTSDDLIAIDPDHEQRGDNQLTGW